MGRKRLYSDEERKQRAKEAARRYQEKKRAVKIEPEKPSKPDIPVVAVDGYDPSPIRDPDYTPFNIADAVLDKKDST